MLGTTLRYRLSANSNSVFSATGSLIGYLFQCRYALLESLRRLRTTQEFTVSLETLDDVVFEANGDPPELLQTKHHLNRAANLTDASPDLWKTLRIWCEGLSNGTIPGDSTFFLITTGQAPEGSAAQYLRANEDRDISKALERLSATAESSTNQDNEKAYTAFRGLSEDDRRKLVTAMVVVDGVPAIANLDAALREIVFYAVERRFLDPFLERLEGWWLRRAIKHLTRAETIAPILSEELVAETTRLREQFKQDNLPIDDEILRASVDASGYQDKIFVHQLRLIEVGNSRIFHAIRNYFRAFEQRSRWIREDLLLVGELDRYEDRLIEEWDLLFQRMRDELGDETAELAKTRAATTLYHWVETGVHLPIRPGVNEPSISRGTYQMLADSMRVGWHPDYAELLKQVLEPQESQR